MKTFWNDLFNDSTPLPLSFEYCLYTQKAQKLLFLFHFYFFINERRKKLRGLIYKKNTFLFLPFSLLDSNYYYQFNQLLLTTYCFPITNAIAKKIICKYNIFKKRKKTVNQSPVSFLDFTIYWIRKILLHVFLIPDTLLSALIKPTPSARGLEGRKRLIVTIITF